MTAAVTRVLVVDNHDSFVHTLVGYLVELGAATELVEADEIESPQARAVVAGFGGVLVSPGPGTPYAAGASIDIVRAAHDVRVPLLGVCLGHQAIAAAFGARVVHAPELMHGMTSAVHHDGTGVFTGIPNPMTATRYHSLAVDEGSLPTDLVVTGRTASGTVMALAHTRAPIVGVQFHPESVLTEGGYGLLGTWLESLGCRGAAARGALLRPHRAA
ncbi:anthranilate synthase component II [Microbacterium sp.]|uniref:anthranilate synthase component II n=1 Tax=Microbacterium sp. TaxID=51671 RepID=UPI003A840F35